MYLKRVVFPHPMSPIMTSFLRGGVLLVLLTAPLRNWFELPPIVCVKRPFWLQPRDICPQIRYGRLSTSCPLSMAAFASATICTATDLNN